MNIAIFSTQFQIAGVYVFLADPEQTKNFKESKFRSYHYIISPIYPVCSHIRFIVYKKTLLKKDRPNIGTEAKLKKRRLKRKL